MLEKVSAVESDLSIFSLCPGGGMRVCSALSTSLVCTSEPQFSKRKDVKVMGLQLYFPVGHGSRAASYSYTQSINPPVKLCQSCWKFDHGVPSARRRTRGLVLLSLEDLEKKESPPGKWNKQCLCRRMNWKTFIQQSRGFRWDGGPLYIKGKRKMENLRRCPWT